MNSFTRVEEYLNSLINYEVSTPLGGDRDRPKLAPVYAACERLNLSRVLPKCIHIAGTVGKGSTAAIAQALLSVRHAVLTFTSPHLVSPKERVQRNGENLPDELWNEGIDFIRAGIAAAPKIDLTYFETTFVFYLWCAQKLGTTAHVVETGLGGSFDATNVLDRTTAVLTRIHLDHTDILGKTISEIARDKSGIIKANCSCFSAEQSTDAQVILMEAARGKGAQLYYEGRDFRALADDGNMVRFSSGEFEATLKRPLHGDFQRHNLAAAAAAARYFDSELTESEMNSALGSIKLRARQQELPGYPNIMIDVCHNPASFDALADSLNHEQDFARRIVLVAMMRDKDARASLGHLLHVADELWVTDAPTPRSRSREELGTIAREMGFETRIFERDTAYDELLALPQDTRGVICGSFYLVGDFLKKFTHA